MIAKEICYLERTIDVWKQGNVSLFFDYDSLLNATLPRRDDVIPLCNRYNSSLDAALPYRDYVLPLCNRYNSSLNDYNNLLPDSMLSCQTKFPSPIICDWRNSLFGNAADCYQTSFSYCWEQEKYLRESHADPQWWNMHRILILIFSITSLLALLAVGYALYRYTKRLKPKKQINELDQVIKDEVTNTAKNTHLAISNENTISESLHLMETKQHEIIRNKKIITRIRLSFVAGGLKFENGNFIRDDKPLERFIQLDGGRDVTRRIFWYAGLWDKEIGKEMLVRQITNVLY